VESLALPVELLRRVASLHFQIAEHAVHLPLLLGRVFAQGVEEEGAEEVAQPREISRRRVRMEFVDQDGKRAASVAFEIFQDTEDPRVIRMSGG
jgi:hypothetical protein